MNIETMLINAANGRTNKTKYANISQIKIQK